MPAKTERGRDSKLYLGFYRRIRSIIKVTLGIGGKQIDGRRYRTGQKSLDRRYRFRRTGSPEHMPRHGFRGTHMYTVRRLAERTLERRSLGLIIHGRSRAVRIDIYLGSIAYLCPFKRIADCLCRGDSLRVWRGNMISIAGRTVAANLGIYDCPAGDRVLIFFKYLCGASLAHDKALTP